MPERLATPVSRETTLTTDELVGSALMHSLTGEAQMLFSAISSSMDTPESFIRWVDEFNACSPEERGAGKYDQGRPLTENVDRVATRSTSKGYPYTVTLHKNGEITLETGLMN